MHSVTSKPPRASSTNTFLSIELPPDEVLRTLRRTRRNACHAKRLFLANDLSSAEGLLISSFDACLAKIEAGVTVRFVDFLRLAECFNKNNLEVVSE